MTNVWIIVYSQHLEWLAWTFPTGFSTALHIIFQLFLNTSNGFSQHFQRFFQHFQREPNGYPTLCQRFKPLPQEVHSRLQYLSRHGHTLLLLIIIIHIYIHKLCIQTVPVISSMWYFHCVLKHCTIVIYACAPAEPLTFTDSAPLSFTCFVLYEIYTETLP